MERTKSNNTATTSNSCGSNNKEPPPKTTKRVIAKKKIKQRIFTSPTIINQSNALQQAKLSTSTSSPSTSSSTSSSLTMISKPTSIIGDKLLQTLKSMESSAQLALWIKLIDNHPFNLNQLRSLQTAIDERIKVDIISNVPYEIALYIMSFLKPRDLCKAAQTCHSWRTVCEDNRLWREKCKEEGLLDDQQTIDALIKNRIINKHEKQEKIVSESLSKVPKSEWKQTYLKHMSILRNWKTRQIKIPAPFIAVDNNSLDVSDDSNNNNGRTNNNTTSSATNSPETNRQDNHNQSVCHWESPKLCNNSNLKYLMQLRCHEESVITCLQYNPRTNTIVSGSDDQTLKVWSSETGRCITTLEGHTGGVWSSQLSPDDIVISGSTDRTLKVWKAHTGQLIHSLHGHTSTVRCLALDGDYVVSGSRDTTLRLWDIKKGVCKHVFLGHSAAVRCVEYRNNIIVSGAYDHLVMVWDALTGQCYHALEGHFSRIYSLQFDGKTVASGSLDSTICIWDALSGKLKHRLEGHQSLTSKMQLKGNLLVSANADSFCKVWNINTGECLQTLGGTHKHSSAITSVHFNNRHVVTSSDDGTVKLWDIRTGRFIRDLVVLPTASQGGVVWRIRASYTKLICAVGSRTQTEDTHLLVLDFSDLTEPHFR